LFNPSFNRLYNTAYIRCRYEYSVVNYRRKLRTLPASCIVKL